MNNKELVLKAASHSELTIKFEDWKGEDGSQIDAITSKDSDALMYLIINILPSGTYDKLVKQIELCENKYNSKEIKNKKQFPYKELEEEIEKLQEEYNELESRNDELWKENAELKHGFDVEEVLPENNKLVRIQLNDTQMQMLAFRWFDNSFSESRWTCTEGYTYTDSRIERWWLASQYKGKEKEI